MITNYSDFLYFATLTSLSVHAMKRGSSLVHVSYEQPVVCGPFFAKSLETLKNHEVLSNVVCLSARHK